MPRPAFIQAPTYWQCSAVYKLVCLNRKLVSGHYGDLLSPDVAVEFRDAMGLCERQFQLPPANDNRSDADNERDLAVLRVTFGRQSTVREEDHV